MRYLALTTALIACACGSAASPARAPLPHPSAPVAGPPRPPPPPAPAVDPSSVRAEAISSRIRFLSDDLLEGRFTGSRGHAIAERYVASELQGLGAEPGGNAASFLQADYEGMAQIARVELLAGFAVANAAERPAWAKGDFLAAKFATKL